MTKPARWYVSDAIVAEYAMVLARPQLKIRKALRQQLLQLIENHTRLVVELLKHEGQIESSFRGAPDL